MCVCVYVVTRNQKAVFFPRLFPIPYIHKTAETFVRCLIFVDRIFISFKIDHFYPQKMCIASHCVYNENVIKIFDRDDLFSVYCLLTNIEMKISSFDDLRMLHFWAFLARDAWNPLKTRLIQRKLVTSYTSYTQTNKKKPLSHWMAEIKRTTK